MSAVLTTSQGTPAMRLGSYSRVSLVGEQFFIDLTCNDGCGREVMDIDRWFALERGLGAYSPSGDTRTTRSRDSLSSSLGPTRAHLYLGVSIAEAKSSSSISQSSPGFGIRFGTPATMYCG
jgi:hypothetical protein